MLENGFKERFFWFLSYAFFLLRKIKAILSAALQISFFLLSSLISNNLPKNIYPQAISEMMFNDGRIKPNFASIWCTPGCVCRQDQHGSTLDQPLYVWRTSELIFVVVHTVEILPYEQQQKLTRSESRYYWSSYDILSMLIAPALNRNGAWRKKVRVRGSPQITWKPTISFKKFAFSIDFQILHFCSRVSRFSIFARNLSPTLK